jgi:uncharacterized protein YcfJ
MNSKSAVIAALVFPVAMISAAQATDFDDYARVIGVIPQIEHIDHPRQECHTEYVQEQRQSRGVGGSLLGCLAVGLLGNQVGGGSGRTAATAVGAITGAIVGDRMEIRESNTV